MSELKARHIVDVYDSYYAENPFGERSQVYLKSEADKVIAEKDKTIALLKDKANYNEYAYKLKSEELADTCRFYEKELRHQKYKRCLAMTMWCKSNSEIYNEFAADASEYMPSYEARFRRRAVLYQKWAMRWLELAEKFKEAK